MCEVQVKGKAETPIQPLPARGCERWRGLGNNFLQHEGSASDLQKDLAATEGSQKDLGKNPAFCRVQNYTTQKWKAPQETKSCLPKAPCELQLGISVWERHLPGTSNLGYLLHGASQGGKRISPKTSLKLYLSLELPVSTAVKEQLFGKCLHNRFSLRFSKICVWYFWLYQCCDPGLPKIKILDDGEEAKTTKSFPVFLLI